MALRKCKECGENVSTKAKRCPHCGAPVNQLNLAESLVVSLFAVIVLFVVIGIISSQIDHTVSPKAAPSQSKPDKTEAFLLTANVSSSCSECEPITKLKLGQGTPALKPKRVKISKWNSQTENPNEFRIYTKIHRPDGEILKPPVIIKTEKDCYEVPIYQDAVWNPTTGTITFWPDTQDSTTYRVKCMGEVRSNNQPN